MEATTEVVVNDQQRIRISQLLSLEAEELSQLLEQLQDGSQATTAINRLVQRLDEKAAQDAEQESWKQQAAEAKANLETKEINFEQQLQQYESKVNDFKSKWLGTRLKLQEATKQAEDSAAKVTEMEQRLSGLQSGSLHANVEIEVFKTRIETLEAEKRDTIAALERKISEVDQVNEDYRTMSTRYQEAKKECSKFESEARESRASEQTQKLQKQAKEQELEMLKQRMDWLNSELTAKSTEFNTYRTEKAAYILQLQSDLDQSRLEANTATQSNTALQRRLQEQQDRLEDTVQKNKELQDKTVLQEEQFRVEMETQRRLGELWERAASDTKGRVADLESTIDDLQQKVATKDSEYQETINEINEDRVQLQIKLEKATIQIEQLKEEQKRADEILNKAGLMDSPDAEFNIGRMGVLSPTAAVAARLQKTGLSLTQVYTRYMELQEDHARLKADNVRVQEAMDSIVKELAEGAPLIREQQLEYQRLAKHAEELSLQLEAASKEKEQLALGARDVVAQLDGVVKERDLLHKENQDLDRQVQNLLWRLRAPNAPQVLAPESTRSVATESSTDGERVIDDHFVLFSNIQELQQQNKKLREIARTLTQQQEALEGTDAKKKVEQDVIGEAERVIEGMREEIGARDLQINSYKQEIEMMRRILKTSNVRNLPAPLPVPESVVAPGVPSQSAEADVPSNGEASEYLRLLTDLQKTFDAYRNETSIDNKLLKDQLQQSQTQNSDYRIQLGRTKTEVEVLNERYQHVVANCSHLTNEMSELRKRCTSLQELSTRHEISSQKLTMDLYAERDSTSRLNAEINNLKTEKALWKSFETRLLEENQALVKEKSHLNELLQTVQNMTNEVERGNEQAKRRLETMIASKEQEAETLKEKLKEENEVISRLRDRKELETKEWQAKLEALQAEHQTSREAHIAAKTSLEHTLSKVEDLTKQIKSLEEQLAIYQPKATGADSTSTATREEQLQAQLVQLHAELARHQSEAATNREHLAQFQAISQTNEDRLAEMTATFEELKKEHDKKLEENAQTIASLEAKLANAEQHAQNAATNLMEMQNKADEERAVWRKEKEEIEGKLRSLQDIETKMKNMEKRFLSDLRVQAAESKAAHENYERELMNHARDIEALNKLKEKHTKQGAELQKYRASSENALANLQEAEASWEAQKSMLQKSLSESEKRCKELEEQNGMLHRHLEDVSAQALSIQQRANAPVSSSENADGTPAEGEGAAPRGTAEHQLAELRDVIRFVRREKEILQCQHELNLQESRRLKQQLEQTNRSLEETRAMLMDERSKHQDIIVSKQQHEQLLEKIDQLNLLRESNTTLRAENDRLQRRLARSEESTRELTSKLDPLNEQVREMKADLEASREELQQVGEDRDRWRTRTVEIMAKHDRIDPTEFQELKDAVEKYKADIAESEKALAALKEESDAKSKELTGRFNKAAANAQAWRKRHGEDAAKMVEVQKELEATKTHLAEMEKKVEEANSTAAQASTGLREMESLQKTMETIQAAKDKLDADNKELLESNETFKKLMAAAQGNAGSSTASATPADTQAAINAAVRQREEELERRYAAQAQSASHGSLTSAEIEARIEAEKQKITAELTKKYDDDKAHLTSMNEMRQMLRMQAKDKEIEQLKLQLVAAGASTTNDKTMTDAQRKQAPGTGLSPGAQPFRPAANNAGLPPRPTNVRVLRPTGPGETAPTPRNMAGVPPRPGQPTHPLPSQPALGPGQSRLRPPPEARAAAAGTPSNAAPSTTVPTPRPAVITPTPTPATEVVPPTNTTPTTSAPASTPAAPANAAAKQSSRLVIKRPREDELPVNLNPALDTTEGGSKAGSPSMGPTTVTVGQETRTGPTIIKRQRPLPVVEGSTVSAQEPTTTTAPQAPRFQRKRAPSVQEGTESQPTTAKPAAAGSEATADSTAEESAGKAATHGHGKKRRHEIESGQETIAIVSTPGPGDIEEPEDVPAPSEPHAGSMAMDVDEAPPVKRSRPDSHGDTPGEPSEAREEAAPETPGQLDYEDAEVEDMTSGAADAATVATPAAEPASEVRSEEAGHVSPTQQSQDFLGATLVSPGLGDVTEFEEVEAQTPQPHEEEEGDLDLEIEEHREHEGEADASESAAV
ncbi:hypothetical protein BGX31_005854 [Mortierella sp. GBA43]|nr:hypothetical protein BGX31_005854 [Mortierella sp. GBA43]